MFGNFFSHSKDKKELWGLLIFNRTLLAAGGAGLDWNFPNAIYRLGNIKQSWAIFLPFFVSSQMHRSSLFCIYPEPILATHRFPYHLNRDFIRLATYILRWIAQLVAFMFLRKHLNILPSICCRKLWTFPKQARLYPRIAVEAHWKRFSVLFVIREKGNKKIQNFEGLIGVIRSETFVQLHIFEVGIKNVEVFSDSGFLKL